MARSDPQINFRIPQELKDALDAASAENRRSLTAEVVARLQASFGVRSIDTFGLFPSAGTSFTQSQAAKDAAITATQSFAEQEHARMLALGGLGSTGSIAAEIQAKMAAEQEAELKKMIAAAIAPAMTDFLEEFKEQERKEREKLIEQITGASAIRELASGKLTIPKKPPKKTSGN